jgi:transcriptional regulator with XRE-family HTH domain
MARKARSTAEKAKDVSLGKRIALLRKERGFTQVELAHKLDVIQAIISDYERGRLRPHPDMLVRLATTLQVSTDELLGIAVVKATNGARVDRRIQRRMEAIGSLPKRDQDALLRTIDAFLTARQAS